MFEETFMEKIERIVTIIAVEETGKSQMFVDKPEHWTSQLKTLRAQYKKEYGV